MEAGMSESGAAPRKVFMSHASEDKERFVLPFARRLRARGLDVWVDRWEMLPGDSLVKKIFTEGIGEAEAVIVVLSKHSVPYSAPPPTSPPFITSGTVQPSRWWHSH
jgi:hypothetical protein